MREELERLLAQYRFELNDERTRSDIKYAIETFLMRKINLRELYDFKVEDRTMFNDDNGLYFQIIYQPTRIPDFMVMDITLWNQEVKISNFEKNVIGSRNIKKLEI